MKQIVIAGGDGPLGKSFIRKLEERQVYVLTRWRDQNNINAVPKSADAVVALIEFCTHALTLAAKDAAMRANVPFIQAFAGWSRAYPILEAAGLFAPDPAPVPAVSAVSATSESTPLKVSMAEMLQRATPEKGPEVMDQTRHQQKRAALERAHAKIAAVTEKKKAWVREKYEANPFMSQTQLQHESRLMFGEAVSSMLFGPIRREVLQRKGFTLNARARPVDADGKEIPPAPWTPPATAPPQGTKAPSPVTAAPVRSSLPENVLVAMRLLKDELPASGIVKLTFVVNPNGEVEVSFDRVVTGKTKL